jgi:hypothetical protein
MANDERHYRDQADRARAIADAANLDNVRDRELRSAAAFDAMADSLKRVARLRAEREATSGSNAIARAEADADADSEADAELEPEPAE